MPRFDPVPWAIATLVFLAIGLISSVLGHKWGLLLLLLLILAVAKVGWPGDRDPADETTPGTATERSDAGTKREGDGAR